MQEAVAGRATSTNPWAWYTSPEVLRLEQERIFRFAWHYAGPLAWVAESGDRFACRGGDVPLAVVRGAEGELRAFVNVCRHRGSELVAGRGRGKTLQCPYHAWTYDLDGSLRAAPRAEREQAFDRSELGLRPAQVGVWGPFVFVNADLEAPPLTETLGRLPDLVDTSGLVFRERVEYELAANWKIAVENFLECYHCPVAHQGFSALVDVDPDSYRLESGECIWSQHGERPGGGSGAQQ